jgi:hypothetical protein
MFEEVREGRVGESWKRMSEKLRVSKDALEGRDVTRQSSLIRCDRFADLAF